MTATALHVVLIECDAPGCSEWLKGDTGDSAHELRLELAEMGWRRVQDRYRRWHDVCDKHPGWVP
jgi:hypothetical protein